MKLQLLICTLLLAFLSYAQIPAGYYSNATGTGYSLKTQLHTIIKGHTDQGYGGLYVTYETSDRDFFYENDGTVLDMYSENPTGIDPYNYSIASAQRCGTITVEGSCYNREHIIPQSIFAENFPMKSDAHFVTPTDGNVNGLRSNFPHGTVGTVITTSLNDSKMGNSAIAGYTGFIFEPIDEFKGDIARMYFYFATRYENTIANYSYPMFDRSSDKVFTTSFLDLLLKWHAQDPVSQREIVRNNAIFARQNNRNPFIDRPEFVQAIWNPVPDVQAPTAATNLTVTSVTSSSISLSWTAGTDNVAVTSYDVYMNGTLRTSISGLSATITGLSPLTSYSFYLISKDASVNSSPPSPTVSGTTTVAIPDTQIPTAPSNLVIASTSSSTISLSWAASSDNIAVTGYDIYLNAVLRSTVTGTSAIINGLLPVTAYSFYVIAKDAAGNSSQASNSVSGTTASISSACPTESFDNIPVATPPSSYGIRTWRGSAGLDWTATDSRTDQIINGKAILVRNGSLTASTFSNGIGNLTVTTRLIFSGNTGTFNIVVNGRTVGTVPYGATDVVTTTTIPNINIEGDVLISLVNNSTSNRVAIDDLSWTCFTELGIKRITPKKFTVYPNPSHGNISIIFQEPSTTHSIVLFSVLGQKVFEKNTTDTSSIALPQLQKGTYFLKITTDKTINTEKIIIN
jgi:endonuclease I/chitodextrinase